MTATFFRRGEGRSRNAQRAEDEGRAPLSRAAKSMWDRIAAPLVHDGEWHHVGKFATRVDYYDIARVRAAGSHIKQQAKQLGFSASAMAAHIDQIQRSRLRAAIRPDFTAPRFKMSCVRAHCEVGDRIRQITIREVMMALRAAGLPITRLSESVVIAQWRSTTSKHLTELNAAVAAGG